MDKKSYDCFQKKMHELAEEYHVADHSPLDHSGEPLILVFYPKCPGDDYCGMITFGDGENIHFASNPDLLRR